MSAAPVPYAGIASRAVALAIDAFIAHLIVLGGGAVLALAASLVGELQLDTTERVLAGSAWAVTVSTYFVLFWAGTGRTPGMRVMDLRVTTATGARPSVARAVVRLVGLVISIVPLFAGFLPVLVDDRRRGLPDLLAGTVVLYADEPLPLAAPDVAAPETPTVRPAAGSRAAPR